MAKKSPGKEGAGTRTAAPKGGKGGGAKLRRWELERRRRRMRAALPLLAVAAGGIALVAAVVLIAPGPPSGGGGPCDYPLKSSHYHAQLLIYRDGVLRDVPGDIGIDPALTFDSSLSECVSGGTAHGVNPVHTHAGEANLLHIESRVDRTYSLGDFFRTWGQPIGPQATWDLRADANHRLTMTVDGQPSDAWGNLVLQEGMRVRIDYTTV
ncbi:MAG TPA: hypothetical protein VGB42_08200 [Candidatus Thermoplasmatota archaeon]